ncbi:3-keto-disaccharide hydrolase [Planctomycetes bacterium TBK1r]|uniref:3-keto-alpha-glucoside-1,2-lyase/3-keto-2-hydroxy-glucal hydratase domain-containing protein n=1 Tax=Stieleria magnilauensis TaxID=2527963 RepID=A0ABX5XN13_9BACT|nr:hypothetical protein TBK1r_09310 [Planctomycetes bacterium TBK1r]
MPNFPRPTLLSGWSCLVLLAACLVPAACSPAADTSPGDEVPLFDGQTLDGWNGDTQWFRVQDGAIVAGSATEKIPANQFLCTDKTYRDFELTVDAKLVGQGNNAGVQFRTKRIPNDTEVIGYQADIGFMPNGTCWGALYDESRRRKFLAESPELAMKTVKRGQWNTLKIIARGDRIQIFLNGVQTVDYTEQDPEIEREGVIGLQVHSGPPLEVYYRNVRLKEL